MIFQIQEDDRHSATGPTGVYGRIVDTDKAIASWTEATRWNGSNHISKATGSQWTHEKLYKSSKGHYYVVRDSQWQGSAPFAYWLSDQEAASWLLLNDHDLPDDLVDLENDMIE